MQQGHARRIEQYYDTMEEQSLCSSRENWRNYLNFLFDRVDFDERSVIDIGGGIGAISFFAGAAGASSVICLEPESSGSKDGMNKTFRTIQTDLDLPDVSLVNNTFQNFDPEGKSFDVVILHNSINHLDEEACTRILKDDDARETYITQFRRLYDMTNPGGDLVITDCSRYNLFGLIGRRSPFAPHITWDLHQSPSTWAKLLNRAGYVQPRIRWTTFNRLGSLMRILLSNRIAAYMLTSRFCLSMKKPL